MEISSSSTGLQYPIRSISLPSRLNPQSIKVEAELNKLKAWETSLVSTIPVCAETVRTGLVGLAELYICVEDLILSPITQQALLQHQNGLIVEEALEGSIGLLDSCSEARDLLSMMKEQVQDLESVLRRKGGDLSVGSNINAYMCCRKKVKKEIGKGLRQLKKSENRIMSNPLFDVNQYLSMVVRVLKDVSFITISVLRSLMLFLSVPASWTRPGGWSLISKLVLTRQVASERGGEIFNEVGSVDVVLKSLHGGIRSNDAKINVQRTMQRLQALDATIKGLEGGLDCLFRRLIRNRVSLLNISAQ
ncbi:Sorting nexin mvp1 like [Actinidia chinensis var. chinensis]|uniref:Sorting nexin mvp1 like n=1 Tax=Actinidia chinensis var. chinensis TaxID=1590841 RepID=A0A2R6RIV4_ACTCC|nr:Sorting nexin mvp1 like [Actinidia chinensis var. chinensis]